TQPWTTGTGNRRWTLVAMCFGLFMALIDVTIVNVALPTIQKDLHTSFSDLQWVVNAYVLSLAVLIVTAGRLGDIFGRRRVFAIGLGIFSLGSLLCGLSDRITIGSLSPSTVLFTARAIQGIGGAAIFPLSLAIISVTFQGQQRGQAIGIWGAVGGLATAIGPLIGGLLVQTVGWQWIFFINVPIGIAGIATTLWAVRESRDERASRSIDFFGLVTVTVSAFCLVLGLIEGNDQGWTSSFIITLFVISAIALIAFILVELRLKHPMVDPRLFKNLSFTGSAIAGFALSAGMFSLFFFLALYLQNSLHFTALEAGVRFLPLSACTFFASPISGRFTEKIGGKTLITLGLSLLAIAVLLFARITPQDTANDWTVLLPGMIVGGIGMGLTLPPLATVSVSTVGRARAGMASGSNVMVRQIGNAFGVAFLGAILTSRYNAYLHDKITALSAPGFSAQARAAAIAGLQKAGTIPGSQGLTGNNPLLARYRRQPSFPALQHIAHDAFVNGLLDIFYVAATILAIGAVASVTLIRKKDLYREEGSPSAQPVAAH
ncbi:MAG: transporter, partial [Chloroflexi bacterium]|nr:transporter [Chloroflexota bacterium]